MQLRLCGIEEDSAGPTGQLFSKGSSSMGRKRPTRMAQVGNPHPVPVPYAVQ